MEWSVVITRYKEGNNILLDALSSLKGQEKVFLEILVLDQFYNKEVEEYCASNSTEKIKFNYIIIEPKSLSYARNFWIKKSTNNMILFLDADAIAATNRAYELIKQLNNDDIAISWTKILPKRNGKRNILTYSHYFWADYSLLDLWNDITLTTKVVWASFGLNKNKTSDECYFDEGYGRKNWILLGWEETDLCARVQKKWSKIAYIGTTYILHQIDKERLEYKRLFKRVFFGWISRYLRWWMPQPRGFKKNIYDYLFLPLYLFFYIPWYIYGFIKYKKCSRN